ncbi:MAG TPA: YggT family protein [Ktedonobacterales bacterium]|nr:YggT family protein [Ktedonobacterales bacterium]
MQNNPPVESDAPTWPAHAPPSPQPYAQPYPPADAQPYPQPRPVPMRAPPSRGARRSTFQADRVARALIQFISLALGILESLLLVRIVLLLLAASPNAGFSRFVYGVTAQFVAPFQGVFPNPFSLGGATLDEAAILAMIVYALAARLLKMAVRMISHL